MNAVTSTSRRTLAGRMSILQTRPVPPTDLRVEYDKRLMLVSGRANAELAAKIAAKLGVQLSPVDAQDVRQRRGLLPVRGVGSRGRRVHRAADLRESAQRPGHKRRADGAARDDRCGRRRIGPPRDRGNAVVRLLAPGQEVGAARADQRAARRADARGRGDRPDPDDGPALRADAGLLPEALRSHDGAVHADPVLRRPRASRTSWSSLRTPAA